ncbi:MAG TPA: adenylate/guanylate cyclase domain-containing protein, partial [Xanthobacteraceae bacterium]|nr:adenylate/guanylate cyclase domain-containing protein [Xanthobacteraceae bacterium]
MTASAPFSAEPPYEGPALPARPKALSERISEYVASRLFITVLLVLLVLAGLPIAVWLDLRNLSERALTEQADELSSTIDTIRNYYASNIVGRVLAHGDKTQVLPNYGEIPGAIPIPATLSLELGDLINRNNGNTQFRFFSDYPFKNRPRHAFDSFEREALDKLRENPHSRVYGVSGSIFDRRVRLATPIIMTAACVSCHNSHPDSPKRDWQVGDVRGIEEFIITQPIAAHIFAFKYLLLYFAFVAVTGLAFIALQHHQSGVIARFNRELGKANEFLSDLAKKIAKYLPPQLYRGIFAGKDVQIATERKKLTVFFSDVVDFTSTAERMQPEEFTALLNEYLTEMSMIATAHGGTVNKFIGDAILVFFGDPETRGAVEDAKACLTMALEMQRRLAELNVEWRKRGIAEPFRARMGINTGFCNVGNFGSDDRMDYTIIGAETNLAARLQSIAQPGEIVLSYETFMLVRDMVRARPLDALTLKGISRPVVPYAVEERIGEPAGGSSEVISERAAGLDLF